MNVTGISLNVAMQQQKKKLKTLSKKFESGIKVFDHESRPDLIAISEEIEKGELLIAELQHATAIYNFKNTLEFEGQEIPLSHAIRIISVLDRSEIRWRGTFEKDDRYGSSERSIDTKYREHVLSFDERAEQQEKAQERAAALRSAIHLANARMLQVDISPEAGAVVKI